MYLTGDIREKLDYPLTDVETPWDTTGMDRKVSTVWRILVSTSNKRCARFDRISN
jgi:hypothetical protein